MWRHVWIKKFVMEWEMMLTNKRDECGMKVLAEKMPVRCRGGSIGVRGRKELMLQGYVGFRRYGVDGADGRDGVDGADRADGMGWGGHEHEVG